MDSILEKPCKKCGETKPLTDFYTHVSTKDGHLNTCKVCHLNRMKHYPAVPREISGNPGEAIAVQKMKSLGIFAMSGKMSRWIYQDVIAWGAVRVECKKAIIRNGKYMFKFDSQARNGTNSHLILLMCDDGYDISFHLFPSDHPVFFKRDGVRRKTGVQYEPFAKHRKLDGRYTLTPEIMVAHKDNWGLIEQKRQLIIQELIDGTYVEDLKAA